MVCTCTYVHKDTNTYTHHTLTHTKLKSELPETYKAWQRVKLTEMNGNGICDTYEVDRNEAFKCMRERPRSCDHLVSISNKEGFRKLVLNYKWSECVPIGQMLRTSHLVKGVG